MTSSVKRICGVVLAITLCAAPFSAPAETYALQPGQNAVGNVFRTKTKAGDTLLDVARNNDLGYTELITANKGIDPWLPGPGKQIVVPSLFLLPDTPRKGIVINIGRQRLFYYPSDGKTVETYPIGVGTEGNDTPNGITKVARKKEHPAWYPTPSERASEPDLPEMVPAGPDNPMGDYVLYLGWPAYGIHGTNKPYGVGRNVSHGCIRLYPEDIQKLFGEVPVGTPVQVVNDEVQVAWIDDELYLAVFPNKEQTDELDDGHPLPPAPSDAVMEHVMTAAEGHFDRIDWDLVQKLASERTGIPIRITKSAGFPLLNLFK